MRSTLTAAFAFSFKTKLNGSLMSYGTYKTRIRYTLYTIHTVTQDNLFV